MDKIPFRRCRGCGVGLEPGEPYWARHPMGGQLIEHFCEPCIRVDWQRGVAELPPQLRALAEAKRPARRRR